MFIDEIEVYGSGGPIAPVEDTEAPSAPQNLRKIAQTEVCVDLAWDESSDNVGVVGYDIYRDGVVIGSTDGGTTHYSIDGLEPGTYAFSVKARDAAGNVSEPSNVLSVTITSAPEVGNLALGKGYTKSEEPHPAFADSGGESTDGLLAGEYWDGLSYGYAIADGETKSVDVVIDLEAEALVSSVRVYGWQGGSNYGADTVSVSVSADGSEFTPMGSASTPDGLWYVVEFPAVSARYVMVNFTKTNNGWGTDWLFIDEIEVYGFATDNLPPTAQDYEIILERDTHASGVIGASDPNGDPLIYSLLDAPLYGTAMVEPDGAWQYVPDAGYHGRDFFTVSVSDGRGGVATSTVNIVVMGDPGLFEITFVYDDFADVSRLQLNSDSTVVQKGESQLLRVTPSMPNTKGSVFSKNRISLSDDRSFSTYFSFNINASVNGGADGLVFAVQTVSSDVGSWGGGIGYAGLEYSLGIEFDTWWNPGFDSGSGMMVDDPNDNHVGVNVNGNPKSLVTIDPPGGYSLKSDSDVWHVWVDYNGPTKILEIRMNKNSSVRPVHPLLAHSVDLREILDRDEAYVGFTSGTGAAYSNHDVLSWYLNNKYAPIDTWLFDYDTAPATVRLTAEPVSNTTHSTISALVINSNGTPSTGVLVSFHTDLGVIESSGITDDLGIARVQLHWDGTDGVATVCAVVSPGGAYDETQVLLSNIPNPPQVSDYYVEVTMNTQGSGVVTAYDPSDHDLVYTLGLQAAHGAALVESDGTWVYTPVTNYVGDDRFTVIADNGHGGTAISTVNITVTDSVNRPPVADAGPDQVVEASVAEGAYVTLSGADSYDPDNDSLEFEWSWAGGFAIGRDITKVFPLGTTQVTLQVTDGRGGTDTDTVMVTVQDTVPPVLSIPYDVLVEATGTRTAVDIGIATATDIFPVSVTSDAPEDFHIGTTPVTWTATDANGNVSTAVQLVTVVDTTAPVLAIPPDIVIEATAARSAVDVGTATATDIFPVVLSNDAPAEGFDLGTTPVTWTATDANGNVSTAVQLVTVVDTTAPVLAIPPDIVIEATAARSAVDVGTATATDIFPVVLSNDAPAEGFDLGTTPVTWTAADANGNVSTAVQLVTVVDTTAPVLVVPSDVLVHAIADFTPVDIGQATATDVFPVVISNNAPQVFPIGTTTVTWEATDTSGNSSVGTQLVTVSTIEATVDVDPDTLNLGSRGNNLSVTAYVELPIGYDVSHIDVSTVVLIAEGIVIEAESRPVSIGDNNLNGIADLMVKFDRQKIIEALAYRSGERVTLTVRGALSDGRLFSGYDIIRVIGSVPSAGRR